MLCCHAVAVKLARYVVQEVGAVRLNVNSPPRLDQVHIVAREEIPSNGNRRKEMHSLVETLVVDVVPDVVAKRKVSRRMPIIILIVTYAARCAGRTRARGCRS